ncbi:hypothetical protein V6N11_022118 [Hibiscus sabdariffa]|uniref:Uncharacterized protein n=1 Tax=Hibiscus sabdariffa TaxID=183260 RepID=A0ABR2TI81_9ROSI
MERQHSLNPLVEVEVEVEVEVNVSVKVEIDVNLLIRVEASISMGMETKTTPIVLSNLSVKIVVQLLEAVGPLLGAIVVHATPTALNTKASNFITNLGKLERSSKCVRPYVFAEDDTCSSLNIDAKGDLEDDTVPDPKASICISTKDLFPA